ncbi:MAG: HNH endonuclease signature motif containing protein [Patescibacteria group bacterium]
MAEKRIYAERAETIKRAVVKRRRKVKEMAVEYLGGRCQVCGYNRCPKALDVHHRDPKRKSFGIAAKGYTRSWEAIKRELNECVLICANCHREVHAGITQLSVEMPE